MKRLIRAYTEIRSKYDAEFMNSITDDVDPEWEVVAHKSVQDYDGFYTDYTLYTDGNTYICMFGDKDIYYPDPDNADFECETYEEAMEWFNSYEGFNEDDIYSSEEIRDNWFDLDWDDQLNLMKKFVQKYKGTKVFEDFANSVDVDVEDIIDSFSDAEAHGDIKISYNQQKDSDFANDDIYSAQDSSNADIWWYFTTHGVQPGSIPRRANVENIIDTPEGTYVALDCVLTTKELEYYDMKEKSPVTSNISAASQSLRHIQVGDLSVEQDIEGDKIYYVFTDDVDNEEDCHEAIFYTSSLAGLKSYNPALYRAWIKKYGEGSVFSAESSENYEDEIQEISQEFTSENTSINSGRLPAIFNMVNFEPGTINLDYGGGRFDNVAEYLTQYDVINLVYDPYNRSKEHNSEVIRTIRAAGGADTATCSNVLNVIKEPEVRINVLKNIKKLVKPSGTVYITVYEGTGRGNEGPTKSGYQLNKKTADYLEEIQKVFPDAKRKGKLITATNNSSVESSTNIDDVEWNLDELRSEVYTKLLEVMQTPEFGFSKDEAKEYCNVDCQISDGYVIVQVGAEVSYEGMEEIAEALNPIIQSVDPDAYFDMEDPGLMSAWIRYDEVIDSSTNINGGTYEPSIDATEYDEPNMLDNYQEELDFIVDVDIKVVDESYWDYTLGSYDWSRDGNNNEWYGSEYHVRLDDSSGIEEKVRDMIGNNVPKTPGIYHLHCYANLVYDVSDIADYGSEIDTDSAIVHWNESDSTLENLTITEL